MNAISKLQNGHRSIRRYRPDPVDPALVEKVLGDAIVGSASSGNLNCVSIVATRDAERRRRGSAFDGAGAASLAQYYTSKAKYDPDLFRRDSAKLAALLAAKHFLP